jgi:hypothetical protein
MNQSSARRISDSLKDLLVTWFFGLVVGAGIWGVLFTFLMAFWTGAMSMGTSPLKPTWAWLSLLVLLCIFLSPILLILIRTHRWIRALVGGVLANIVCILVFAVLFLSKVLDLLNAKSGLSDTAMNSMWIAIPLAVSLLVVNLAGSRKADLAYWGWLFAGGAAGAIAAIMSGYLLNLIIGHQQINNYGFVFFIIPPLVWLYSTFFINVFPRDFHWKEASSNGLLVLLLAAITLWIPSALINFTPFILLNLR